MKSPHKYLGEGGWEKKKSKQSNEYPLEPKWVLGKTIHTCKTTMNKYMNRSTRGYSFSLKKSHIQINMYICKKLYIQRTAI